MNNLLQKIKKIKNIELYIAVILVVVVVAMVFLGSQQKTTTIVCDNQSYIAEMESKIITVLKGIDGCGEVSVAISYANQGETEYAYQTTTTTIGNKTEEVSTLILVDGEPVVIQTFTPQICGVVVVATGARDATVKHKIVLAVVTLLDVDTSCVQVLS